MTPEHLYWGLRFADWVTLGGLVFGPVAAVAITLWIEARRKKREQRMQVLRMLLSSRHLPGDPVYSIAINLIPIEFNEKPKVMTAWRSYIESVRYKPSTENADEHSKVILSNQTKLLFETMRCIGFNLSETDIQTSAYAADGFIQRDNILIASQLAMPEIAKALNRQIELIEGTTRQ